MNSTAVAAFATIAVTLIVLPGPDWAFLLTAGARRRHVLPAVTGLVIGYLILTAVVAAGIGPVVAAAPAAMVVLTIVGAGYLLHLGIAALRHAPDRTQAHTDQADALASSSSRVLRRGIGVSGLNPKSLLFFLAFLPQFTRPDAPWLLPVQLAFLGTLWAAIAAVVYTVMGYTAHHAVNGRPRMQRAISLVAGVAMILAGTGLLGEQVVHVIGAHA